MRDLYGRMAKMAADPDPRELAAAQEYVRAYARTQNLNRLVQAGAARAITHPHQGAFVMGIGTPLGGLFNTGSPLSSHSLAMRAGGATALGALGLGAYGVYRGGKALYEKMNEP